MNVIRSWDWFRLEHKPSFGIVSKIGSDLVKAVTVKNNLYDDRDKMGFFIRSLVNPLKIGLRSINQRNNS